jgi:hypothetical protein
MLTLPTIGKWFYMILSGEKGEEYRDIKLYYTSRFKKYLICTLIQIYRMGPTKGKSNLGMGTEKISRNL